MLSSVTPNCIVLLCIEFQLVSECDLGDNESSDGVDGKFDDVNQSDVHAGIHFGTPAGPVLVALDLGGLEDFWGFGGFGGFGRLRGF